jgi:O-antigen biosynthesis protein WbqV
MAAQPVFADRARLQFWLHRLEDAVASMDRSLAERVFEEAIPEFKARKPAPTPPARPVLRPVASIRGA